MNTGFHSCPGAIMLASLICVFGCRSQTSENPRANVSADTGHETRDEGKSNPQLSIVYSPEYLIDLGGLERLHPFDIRKYEKIH